MAPPPRPRPDDFRAMFIQHGWSVAEHYGAHWTVMRRWVDEEGREELLALRAVKVRDDIRAATEARRRRTRGVHVAPHLHPARGDAHAH